LDYHQVLITLTDDRTSQRQSLSTNTAQQQWQEKRYLQIHLTNSMPLNTIAMIIILMRFVGLFKITKITVRPHVCVHCLRLSGSVFELCNLVSVKCGRATAR